MAITQDWLSDRRAYYVLALAGVGTLAGALFWGYQRYARSKEEIAYKDLATSIDGYVKAMHMGPAPEKWTDVTRGFEVAAQRNPSSKLSPYFLVYQADILVQQDKIKEAAALMDKALALMDAKNPVYSTFALKRALLNIDSGDAAQEKRGRNELEKLAQDPQNPAQDMALYYSALDAETRKDKALADKRYKEILAHKHEDSYWYQRAQTKVKVGA